MLSRVSQFAHAPMSVRHPLSAGLFVGLVAATALLHFTAQQAHGQYVEEEVAASEQSKVPSGRQRSIIGGSVELFGTRTIDEANREENLFGFGFGGSLYLEINPFDLLGIQVGGTGMYISGDEAGATEWLGLAAGPRFHWATLWDSRDDFWVDGHWVFGRSGEITRHGFDVGIGYEFALDDIGFWRLGPMLRFMWASDPGVDTTIAGVPTTVRNNPMWINFGVSLGIGGAKANEVVAPPPADADGDGIIDSDDVCPTVHQGARPDPNRPGCPSMVARDTDGDGVSDDKDMCPELHQGPNPDPNRPGCPTQDTDGDGVPNAEDICPSVPMGPRPDPERVGCPLPDRDGDTVLDNVDACPDEPGAPSTNPERNGCPGLVRVQDGQIRINRPVYFAFDKDRILRKSYPVLQAVADAVLASSDLICGIRVEGHTDSQGLESYNFDLSERRSRNVARALRKFGVDASKLAAQGFGPSRPVDTNETEEGRAANRRVEFHITEWCDGGSTDEVEGF